MKHLSLRSILLSLLLPPLLFVFSLQTLEWYLQRRYEAEIGRIYIGEVPPLLDGSLRIRDAVGRNIRDFLDHDTAIALGVEVRVTVTTADHLLLFPVPYEDVTERMGGPEKEDHRDPILVAQENYQILNEGPLLRVAVKVPPVSWLGSGILLLYILCFALILYREYRKGLRYAKEEEARAMERLHGLLEQEKQYHETIRILSEEKESISSDLENLKGELKRVRDQSKQTEEEVLKDMLDLEERLKVNLELQKEQEKEIARLKEEIAHLERFKGKEDRQKRRTIETTQKRFKVLYKNVHVHERAIEGLLDLDEGHRLKGEEIIHQLNENDSLVPVKRKVFIKKGSATILEVLFAYNGRLYFRKIPGQKIEILAVGTKNTQEKDLAYLERL